MLHSAWPTVMSFYLFVQTTALITWSLYLSIFFACALFFGLFQAIGRHFQPANDQTDTHCCITANAWAFNRPDLQNYSSVFLHAFLSHCVSQWLPSLAPTHAIPLYFILRESIFCQTQVPANKMWMPVINEIAQRSGSSELAAETVLLYLLSMAPGHLSWAPSHCLQASTPVPDQRVCRQAFVVTPVYYTCTWQHLCACYALRCFKIPLGFRPHACLNMPEGGSFFAQLESWFSCCS